MTERLIVNEIRSDARNAHTESDLPGEMAEVHLGIALILPQSKRLVDLAGKLRWAKWLNNVIVRPRFLAGTNF